jgi:hypothetical protein
MLGRRSLSCSNIISIPQNYPASHLTAAKRNRVNCPFDRTLFVPACYKYLKNSLIIQEQNTKKNHKRVVVLYVIKNHVNLHKL